MTNLKNAWFKLLTKTNNQLADPWRLLMAGRKNGIYGLDWC